jgi:hypothetical protein
MLGHLAKDHTAEDTILMRIRAVADALERVRNELVPDERARDALAEQHEEIVGELERLHADRQRADTSGQD